MSDILEKKRILCVEDHQDTCDLIAFLLSEYTVVFSDSVAKSIELFRTQHFDLCLLDNWLIDGFGTDLCRQILEISPHTPIIFTSGVAQKHEIEKALAAGAKAYLVKPYNPDELQEVVKELI